MITFLNLLRLRIRVVFGYLFNLAGIPGLVRSCDYEAGITDARIRVRVGEMFTVITVNELDIYFHRLTGKIDGVGLTVGCRYHPIADAEQFPTPPDYSRPLDRK